jgi:hypothetical protein
LRVRTTLSLYGHLFPERDEQLSGRLDDLYRETSAAHLMHDENATGADKTKRGLVTCVGGTWQFANRLLLPAEPLRIG